MLTFYSLPTFRCQWKFTSSYTLISLLHQSNTCNIVQKNFIHPILTYSNLLASLHPFFLHVRCILVAWIFQQKTFFNFHSILHKKREWHKIVNINCCCFIPPISMQFFIKPSIFGSILNKKVTNLYFYLYDDNSFQYTFATCTYQTEIINHISNHIKEGIWGFCIDSQTLTLSWKLGFTSFDMCWFYLMKNPAAWSQWTKKLELLVI